jgi:phage terminase large subunit
LSLIAGRRGGKTKIGALAAVEQMMTIPGSLGWACAPTYPKLHDYVMPAIREWIPPQWFKSGYAKESIEHKEIRIGTSLVQFRSLDDPDAGRGPGLDWCWIDEVCEVAELAWDTLRPALTEKRGVAWFTTSPRGFDWVYKRFWVPAQNSEPGYWACRYKTSDNPIIDAVELEKARVEMSAERYRQEYEADFVSFEGAIFQVPSQSILRTPEAIKEFIPEWPRIDPSRESIVGIDPGTKHPFAAVWLVKTPKGLVAVWEYREQMRSAREHAGEILRRTAGHQPRFVIDRTQKQSQIELAQHHLFAAQVEGGPGSVKAGIDRVKAWFEQGRLFIIEETCPHLIEELVSYRWADTAKKDGALGKEEPFKHNDDLCDAFRYALMSWPELPAPPVKEKPLGRDLEVDPLPPGMEHTFARMQRIAEPEDGLTPVEEHPVGNMGYVGMTDEDQYNLLGGLE